MNHTNQLEYEVYQRDDGTFHVTGPNDMEFLIVPAKTDAQRRESARLDWLLEHNSSDADKDSSGCYIVAWVSDGAPGNEQGPSGRFVASGATHRECIDRFLSGDIKRID